MAPGMQNHYGLSKRWWVAMASAGPYEIICTSLQTDNHASTSQSPLSFTGNKLMQQMVGKKQSIGLWQTESHTHTTILQLSGLCPAQPWIFWSKMKITQADAPTIWMNCQPIQTWCQHLCHPHHFYAGCPSLHNSPNLSWLGTGTKYAGLHTRWQTESKQTISTAGKCHM